MKKRTWMWTVENAILISCLFVLFAILSLTVLDISKSVQFRLVWITVSFALSVFVGHTVFSLRNRNRKAQDEWFRLKMQHSENSMCENYQKESEALMEEYKRLGREQHDIYANILGYINNKDYEKIMPFLQEKMPKLDYGDVFLSGNQVVDVILNQKIPRATKEGLHVQCDIQLPFINGIKETDLNVLLSNLLDNAIEAAVRRKNEGCTDNVISLRIRTYKGYLLIYEENPCSHEDIESGGVLKTTKLDARVHGIGMQSMKRIVDCYHGVMDYEIKDNRFFIRVVMEDTGIE